jgi:hypothetical protein
VILRRLFGVAGVLLVLLAGLGACTVRVGSLFTGAAGDHIDRFGIAVVVAVILGIGMAIIGFGDWPIGSIPRSPAFYLFSALIVALVGWAVFGIDSTRPVRELPEARLAYPGAVEVRRTATPIRASLDSSRSAQVSVSFTVADPYSAVEAFYREELAKRGWAYSWTFGSPGTADKYINWKREGFTFQLQLLSPKPGATPGFTTVIYGPPA